MPLRRSLTVVTTCLVATAALGVAPAAGATPPGAWVRPVDGPVVEPFRAPPTSFGPGHRGVDFGVPEGTDVRAAGDGTVVYAGTVAGTLHVSVAHEGGLRTSYSFLADVLVRRGMRVRAGQVVGTSGASPHGPRRVHFGLRVGDTYVDPMLLYSPVDLAEVVALAPTVAPYGYTAAAERRSILAGIVGGAIGAFDAAARFAGGLVARAPGADGIGYVIAHLRQAWPGLPVVSKLRLALTGVRTVAAWWTDRRRCGPGAPHADGTGGSGNHVLLVAGLGSSTGRDGRTFDLPFELLGYEPGDATWFSYAGDGGAYGAADTYAPTLTSAARLAEQLRARQREEPGRPVDLIAHSHGGVVVLAFLELLYDPDDPSFPPIGHVVTIASPLEGVPLASWVAERAGGGELGRTAVGLGDRLLGDTAPDPWSAAVADLAEGSDLMRRLAAAPLPEGVRLTTIGSMFDVVVPADMATTDGATHTVVTTDPIGAHGDVTHHPETLRAVRAALEGRRPPCRAVLDLLLGEVVPPVIAGIETLAVPQLIP